MFWHPERPGRHGSEAAAADTEDKPIHFGDVMLTGKLLSPILKIESYHIRTEYATNGPQLHRKQCC
jgi:hypothetical protein